MPNQWSLQDAKNKFSEVVKAARRGTAQLVTRRGVPAVMVVSVETYETLQRHEKLTEPSFGDFLLAMPRQERPEEFERADLNLRDVDL